MKNYFLFFVATLSLLACTKDQYNGDERTVLEGRIISGTQAVKDVEVMLFPTSFLPEDSSISEIEYQNPSSGKAISSTKTDNDGYFSTSFPRSEDADVYFIRIQKGSRTIYYGYISPQNIVNYHINVGNLNF